MKSRQNKAGGAGQTAKAPELRPPSESAVWAALCERHSERVQRRLAAARVAVAGLGGLGSNIAVSLARSGVGHLHLIDFDRVDLTNLHRQQYFLRHIGMEKTAAMEEILREINPYLDIRADCVRVTEDNLRALFSGEDYICEAFDRAEQKAMLVNGVLTGLPGKILVSGSGMAGYGGGNDIKTRKLTECFYLCGDGVTEAGPDAGLTAARVALCAAHQANVVIERIILGKPGGQTETM